MCSEFSLFLVSFFYLDERSCFAIVEFNALIELFDLKRLYVYVRFLITCFCSFHVYFFSSLMWIKKNLVPKLTPQYIAIEV